MTATAKPAAAAAAALTDLRHAQATARPKRTYSTLMSAATPISRPARTAPPTPICARAVLSPRGPFSRRGVRARSATIPSRPNNAASPSMWPLATISHSSSGFTDHSKWARSRISGSERSRRSRARITAQKATASSSFSQKVMRASDVPPSSAAPHSAAVARGP